MKLLRSTLWALIGLMILTGAAFGADDSRLFQYSTIDALLEGVYDGDLTLGALLEHGDLGLGTFNGLDGEMVVLDGKVYQVRYSGKVELMPAGAKTPFAQVVNFSTDLRVPIKRPVDFAGLKKAVRQSLVTPNLFYAVRIRGQFDHIKARSVPRQNKPYPILVDVVKKQAVFEFNNVQGDIVGFISPSYVKGLGAPGWHIHFLRSDRQAGGHVLDLKLKDVTVQVNVIPAMDLKLPISGDFLYVELGDDKSKALQKVEGK